MKIFTNQLEYDKKKKFTRKTIDGKSENQNKKEKTFIFFKKFDDFSYLFHENENER